MDKARRVVIVCLVYFLVFWIGLKSGEAYYRMRNKLEADKQRLLSPPAPVLPEPVKPGPRVYFTVERFDRGNYTTVNFEEISETSPIIKFLSNEKLKPLLKLRDIQIYAETGERVY